MVASNQALPLASRTPAGDATTYAAAALSQLARGDSRLRDDHAPVDQLETR